MYYPPPNEWQQPPPPQQIIVRTSRSGGPRLIGTLLALFLLFAAGVYVANQVGFLNLSNLFKTTDTVITGKEVVLDIETQGFTMTPAKGEVLQSETKTSQGWFPLWTHNSFTYQAGVNLAAQVDLSPIKKNSKRVYVEKESDHTLKVFFWLTKPTVTYNINLTDSGVLGTPQHDWWAEDNSQYGLELQKQAVNDVMTNANSANCRAKNKMSCSDAVALVLTTAMQTAGPELLDFLQGINPSFSAVQICTYVANPPVGSPFCPDSWPNVPPTPTPGP